MGPGEKRIFGAVWFGAGEMWGMSAVFICGISPEGRSRNGSKRYPERYPRRYFGNFVLANPLKPLVGTTGIEPVTV